MILGLLHMFVLWVVLDTIVLYLIYDRRDRGGDDS